MTERQIAKTNEDFELLTLACQLDHLTKEIERQPAFDLIRLCAPIRDPAPLAWLSRRLLERNWFGDEGNRRWFAEFLVALPETTVDKLLKSLTSPPVEYDWHGSLCDLTLKALQVVPLRALSSMCLLDRTMKHHFPAEREQHLNRIFDEIAELLSAGSVDAIPVALLAQMSALQVINLEGLARDGGEANLAAFRRVRKKLAEQAIQVLEDAPKAVSQANAEDLLARRVYTDPGHFLIELLQNAEDAGAKSWRVVFDKDKLIVWHDGIPFDTRDVVGITSIGQTTKRKQQIGFFGVGFKSVYEITERPQIYSDVYCFEIADVSIPKLLAQRPDYLPPDGTAVVLPLRGHLDEERGPKALYEKGKALDACVLLTLRSIDVIDFHLTETAGGNETHKLIECASEIGSSIKHEPSGKVTSYLMQDDEYKYTGEQREAGRPDATKVMVGILLDETDLPVPLPPTAAEVYSYLPTREQPGLRFFVQGHFDVPVDRERIAPDSLWNRWLLLQVPHQLKRLAERIAAKNDRAFSAGFINVLPLKRELPNPPFAQIPGALGEVLGDIEFVPAANGRLISPKETLVSAPAIVSLFDEDQIDEKRSFLACDLSSRHQDVLLELGAERFDTAALLAYLESAKIERSTGFGPGSNPGGADFEPVSEAGSAGVSTASRTVLEGSDRQYERARMPAPPGQDSRTAAHTGQDGRTAAHSGLKFLRRLDKLERLYDLFLTELESFERKDQSGDLADWVSRLKALPIVPDSDGQLRTPGELARGSNLIREIYADSKRFISHALEAANARTIAFFDRLEIEKIDLEFLIENLEKTIGNSNEPLEFPRTEFPTDETCVSIILEALAPADWSLLKRVGKLPLFRSADGRFYPVATDPDDLSGVVDGSGSSLARDLARFYGTSRPIATELAVSDSKTPTSSTNQTSAASTNLLSAASTDQPSAPSTNHPPAVSTNQTSAASTNLLSAASTDQPSALSTRHESAASTILQRLGAPGLSLAVLANDLQRRMFGSELPDLQNLHELLDAHVDEISDKVAKQLIQLPIWPDSNGNAHVLSGDNQVFIAVDAEICEIFPDAPFLDQQVATRRHTKNMPVAPVSVSHVIEGLAYDALPPASSAQPLSAGAQPFFADAPPPASITHPRLSIVRNAANVERALAYILNHAGAIDSVGIKTLRERAVFLSDRGIVLPLSNLSRAESPDFRKLYNNSDIRNFIDEAGPGWSLVKELGIDNSLAIADIETLAADLEADLATDNTLKDPETGYKAILTYLSRRVDKMTRPLMLRIVGLPIFPDTAGNTASLTNEKADRSPKFAYPASSTFRKVLQKTGVRLLNAEMETTLRPLLIAAKIPEAGFQLLVESLQDNPVSDDEILDAIQDLFVTRKYELQEAYPPGDRVSKPNQTLNKLPVWKTISGEIKGARDIMGGNLSELLEPNTSEFDDLQKACITPLALKRLHSLAPLMVPISPESFIADLIKRTARDGEPLSAQPYFLSSTTRVMRLYEVVGNRNKIELPSVDAAGNLTFSELFFTDNETLALLKGLPILKQILHPELTAYFELGKDEPGRLGNIRNQVAKLWSKMISTRGFNDFVPLPPLMVISALGPDMDADRRAHFYKWLLVNKLAVFDDKATVAKLVESPLFLTSHGNMVKPGDLVFDSDFPDLGIDWLPSPEIPKQLLETIQLHLEAGSPNTDELIKRHIVPSYEDATARGDREQAGRLLLWLAKRLSNRSEIDIKRLTKGKRSPVILLEDLTGRFCLPRELLLPAPEIRSHVKFLWKELPQPSESYPAEIHPFLQALGVMSSPGLESVAQRLIAIATKDESIAAANIIAYLRQLQGGSIYKKLPQLQGSSWLVDGEGKLKAAFQLFIRSYEVETLVGAFPELYLDKEEEAILGQALTKELGFRSSESASALEVMRHIDRKAANKEAVSQSVYSWMATAASQGELKLADIESYFGDRPWILTDDDEYASHKKVIGTRAFHLFGNLRGYWTRGWKTYPALCKVLGIKDGTTPHSVRDFLQEVGTEVSDHGSKQLLKREPALPLMMVNCFAVLSKKGITVDKGLAVIPAVHRQSIELVPASSPGLYWSDTPTLEALFANVGKLYLARRGTGDDTDDVDAFYTAMGIRRLRETYKIIAAKREGSDRSSQMADKILSLRNVLRALLAVIPRIEIERELSQETTWVYSKHLRSLAASGSIRAIEGLKVRYVLPGVGETEVERPAAYDTGSGELCIDTMVLSDPDLTGLSEGLLPAIIEGPAAESFIDLFEILLSRRTQEDMTAYLNRRHFAEANAALNPVDRLAQRIGELLDYGLADKLVKRCSVLKKRDLSKWREPSLIKEIESCATTDGDKSASDAAEIMLRAIDLAADDHAELADLITKLLLAHTISDCSEVLIQKKQDDGPVESIAGSANVPSASKASSTPVKTSKADKPAEDVPKKQDPQKQEDAFKGFFDNLFGKKKQDAPAARDLSRETEDNSEESSSSNQPELPDWLLGNYFKPAKTISSQIWYSSRNIRLLEATRKSAYLSFSPGRLPTPHLYAVSRLGVSFNSMLQSWSSGRTAQKFFLTPGEPSGRIVSFSGYLNSGKSRLPLPLYCRLLTETVVVGGNAGIRSMIHDELGVVIDIAGSGIVDLKYDVEILSVPDLNVDKSTQPVPDKALISPTVPIGSLPAKLVEWINQTILSDLSEAKRTVAAQDFIRSNYQYDGAFTDRSDVKAARNRLPVFSSNHHLELLHASADDRVLGHGVCYELNVLLVEVLRHLKIPACIATGWVFDEGVVDLPDHLFALAILNSGDGLCVLPLDAAATDRGPIRTIHRRRFPPPATALPARPSLPTVKGVWNVSPRYPSTTRSSSDETDARGRIVKFPEKRSGKADPPTVEGGFQKLVNFFTEKNAERRNPKDPPKQPDQKMVPQSTADARVAEERRLRKQVEDTLAKEKLLRQRAETKLGEERRLRRQAEEKTDLNDGDSFDQAPPVEPQTGPLKNEFLMTEPRRQAEEYQLLCKAYDLVTDTLGLEAPAYPLGTEGLRQKLIKLLGSSKTLETFLGVLRSDVCELEGLTDEIKLLEDLRLIEIETVPILRIHIIDSSNQD